MFEVDALHHVRPQINQDDDKPYGNFALKEDIDELIVSRPKYPNSLSHMFQYKLDLETNVSQ